MTTHIFPTTADCEIVSSRVVRAPVELVFKAWTDPDHLKNWWGPAGFTNTFHEYDLRPGGMWRFVMHGPDKGNYVNECEFVKIEKPYLVAWKRHSKPLFKVAATFEEVVEGQTKVLFRMVFDTTEECDKLKKFVIDKNEGNFDKLEVELTKMSL